MNLIKVYHYTDFSKIGQILGKISGEKSGLEPKRFIGQAFMPAREKLASFAFLEPMPETWITNTQFPLSWKSLVHDLDILNNGKLLLEISIEPQKDEAYVGDRSHIEGALYIDTTHIPEKYHHKSLVEGEQKFMESLIPLTEYLEREKTKEISYSLPEVVIFNNIPTDRIAIPDTQPLIDEDLKKPLGENKKILIELILHGYAAHELDQWRQNYELKNGPLQNHLAPELLG